ncbi:basic helix-loop-helix (bHLH) DNA-bindingsuperfamily protein [Striga asiatica]|uniref:Basic helix-loop-helix (BHLH) DNA-bindingsuperfamily protein n=1 Tax=Striga asiatica TaxID=4170 RepID=A0A5A7QXV4_STRAF|nr:basic helix-loop-helix (bHLH) DNA-bindingsuperfamily protein [Striga asiatica]
MEGENLSDFFEDDIFSVLEAWESANNSNNNNNNNNNNNMMMKMNEGLENYSDSGSKEEMVSFAFQKSCWEVDGGSPSRKRPKFAGGDDFPAAEELGQHRMSHITVERNRRKQMNDNLAVLRSLMPCFYAKRGDQASIIGGVVDYINELQQLIQSLEAKRQRKSYSDILSPRPISSPRKPPLSPRTPQPGSPYKAYKPQPTGFLNSPSSLPSPVDPSPCNSSTSSINDAVNELVANSKSATAEVEVKFSGPNLMLKTVSPRVPNQTVRIVEVLEELDLQILHVKIATVDDRLLNTFTIKVNKRN